MNQVDIAPTIASLWGLRVPTESQGKIILDIVEPFQSSQQLAATYINNCEHLMKMLGDSREASTYRLWLSAISQMEKPLSVKKYIELETELSSALKSLKQDNNSFSFSYTSGIFLLTAVEILLLVILTQSLSPVWSGSDFVAIVSFIPPIFMYFSSSFIEEEHYIRHFIFSCIMLCMHSNSASKDYVNLWGLVKVLCVHRVLISFNQTGDKWSHLKDLNDWIMDEKLTWLSAIIGVILVWRFLRSTNRSSKFCTANLMFVYLSKIISNIEQPTRFWQFM